MELLIAPQVISPDVERGLENNSNEVFLLCLFQADVSLRTDHGLQALHTLVIRNKWSAEFSSHFIDLAYILIHFGGADVFAVMDDDNSPTTLAFRHGWWDEWEIVLERCGFDPNTVLRKEIDRLSKIIHLDRGESTAVDTEDLISHASEDVTRRKAIVGDRLDE